MIQANLFRVVGMVVAMGLLASCGGGIPFVSRGDPRPVDVSQLPSMRLVGWQIEVPQSLEVSEENRIKPLADIVWRGDPPGDRHAQVKAIFETAVNRVSGRMSGEVPITIGIGVSRFHAVTDFLRYQFDGEHEIEFTLTAVNAQTGEVIIPAYRIDATFPSFGGQDAVQAELAGVTQKVRILEQLENRLFQELTGAPVENISDEVPGAPAAGDGS